MTASRSNFSCAASRATKALPASAASVLAPEATRARGFELQLGLLDARRALPADQQRQVYRALLLPAAGEQRGLPAARPVVAVAEARIRIGAGGDAVRLRASNGLALDRQARAHLAHQPQHLLQVDHVRRARPFLRPRGTGDGEAEREMI